MDNLHIYNLGREVPETAKKQFDNGKFSGTDISPMWRIKKLTEMFGPVGFGWYYEILSERSEEHGSTTIAIVDINLYVKMDGEWSKPIYGTGGNNIKRQTRNGESVSDEGYKMALTDALSVACKALGIGADVYWDKDKTKYTAYAVASEQHAGAPVCEMCDAEVAPLVTKDGKVKKSADEIAAYTKKMNGRCLCWGCYNKVLTDGGR